MITREYTREWIMAIRTDKAFSIPGSKSIKYLKHKRLMLPAIDKEKLQCIILNGGEVELKPERRFDAAVQAHMAARNGN